MQYIGIKREFDKTAECQDGGEIDQAIQHLYNLCQLHDVPLFGVIIYKSTETSSAFSAFQVVSENEIAPEFIAMDVVLKNDELCKAIVSHAIMRKTGLEVEPVDAGELDEEEDDDSVVKLPGS